YGEAQNRVGNVYQSQARPGQARTVKCYNCNGAGHIARNCTQPKLPQNSEYFKDKMLLMQAQENGVALDAKQLLFLAGGPNNAFDDDVDEQPVQDLALNVDNVFQAEDCDAFDSDVDEAPTAQTMFMANLLSADPIIDEAGLSYDSDILSEVQDHNQYLDDACAYEEEHVMHDSTKEDRESQLYDDFEHFRQHKEESIHDYYVSSPADDLIKNLTSTLALLTQSYRTFLPQINNQLRTSSNARNQATVQDGRVVVQNVQGQPNRGQGMNPRGGSAAGYGEAQNRVGNVYQSQARPGQARTVKCYNCNGAGHIARNCTQPKLPQNSEYFKDKMLLMQAQENGVALDAKQLLFLAGGPNNAFDDDVDEQPVQDLALNVCDAFDSDVDEAPTAQTMFMANLLSADPITDEAEPCYDSDIMSEVQDHNQYLDDACAYEE
nr:hypothetical protein [Tanacetum cinerariifolium]